MRSAFARAQDVAHPGVVDACEGGLWLVQHQEGGQVGWDRTTLVIFTIIILHTHCLCHQYHCNQFHLQEEKYHEGNPGVK